MSSSFSRSLVSTPGLISKSKIKANHTYQIRLTDMFNALSTSTQTKSSNPQSKVNKSSTTTTLPSANPLDSNPAPKRGKEREQPKPRKPTKLKRIINKELEENQKQRQQLLTKSSSPKQLDQYVHFKLSPTPHPRSFQRYSTHRSNNQCILYGRLR